MTHKKKIYLCVDRDQFKPFDYSISYDDAMVSLGGNSGNNVFQYVLQTILDNDNNKVCVDYDFLHRNDTAVKKITPEYFDYINNNFDILVFSPANVIALFAKNIVLKIWAERLEKVKIPIVAIGLGAQSNYDYDMSFLYDIEKEVLRFVKSILKNNGFIGTRGFFTSECLSKLGFNEGSDFQTIGCPSLFLHGGDLKIETPNLNPEDLRIAFNGFTLWNIEDKNSFMKKYPVSVFVDQEEFYRLLYKQEELTWKELQYLSNKAGVFLSNYLNDRVKLYGDFPSWYNDFKRLKINFSLGCRVHGNVVPLLNGIPCHIDIIDSRTRELCEYFHIPNTRFDYNFPDPYEIYKQTYFGIFNRDITEKYNTFKNFANKCGIVFEPCNDVPDFKPHLSSNEDKELIKYIARICLSNQPIFNRDADKLHSPLWAREANSQLIFKQDMEKLNKKIVFVAHEFGLYSGHGGIASYLYNICKYLLENTNFNISVLAEEYDKNCDLMKFTKLAVFDISGGDLNSKRDKVLSICKEIQPDYVEISDYCALGLHLVLEKSYGKDFQNTAIITNNHTAMKEIFEWSTLKDFKQHASNDEQFISNKEKLQMKFSDYCIAPSFFLAKYVKKNYGLTDDVLVFANPYLNKLKTKKEIVRDIEEIIDLEPYKNSFNIALVTRFEGRKNQILLVKTFEKLLSKYEDCHLFLAGNTSITPDTNEDYRFKTFEAADLNHLDRIHFFDFMNLMDQEKLMAVTDLTVMPSTFENQPVAMIEAVMREIPVIGSKYSGIADYSPDEMLFNPFDEEGLYICLNSFLEKTKEERKLLQMAQQEKLKCFINPEASILPRFCLQPKVKARNNRKLNLQDRYHD
jgi:glycosyltransferase involved in cell wall biosynthesis